MICQCNFLSPSSYHNSISLSLSFISVYFQLVVELSSPPPPPPLFLLLPNFFSLSFYNPKPSLFISFLGLLPRRLSHFVFFFLLCSLLSLKILCADFAIFTVAHGSFHMCARSFLFQRVFLSLQFVPLLCGYSPLESGKDSAMPAS